MRVVVPRRLAVSEPEVSLVRLLQAAAMTPVERAPAARVALPAAVRPAPAVAAASSRRGGAASNGGTAGATSGSLPKSADLARARHPSSIGAAFRPAPRASPSVLQELSGGSTQQCGKGTDAATKYGYVGPGAPCNVYEFMVYALSVATAGRERSLGRGVDCGARDSAWPISARSAKLRRLVA